MCFRWVVYLALWKCVRCIEVGVFVYINRFVKFRINAWKLAYAHIKSRKFNLGRSET